jgi:hypothetical protein
VEEENFGVSLFYASKTTQPRAFYFSPTIPANIFSATFGIYFLAFQTGK